jgi:hypothetical protein
MAAQGLPAAATYRGRNRDEPTDRFGRQPIRAQAAETLPAGCSNLAGRQRRDPHPKRCAGRTYHPHRTAPVTPTQTHDTRRESRRARLSHRNAQAGHGWTATALPLTATLADRLADKARVFEGTAKGDGVLDLLEGAAR